MKIRTSIKKKELLPGEQLVRRNGRIWRLSPNPRRKARQ